MTSGLQVPSASDAESTSVIETVGTSPAVAASPGVPDVASSPLRYALSYFFICASPVGVKLIYTGVTCKLGCQVNHRAPYSAAPTCVSTSTATHS